jgi:mannose-6-phosphate isomerase-like protein (cupin superfamily)
MNLFVDNIETLTLENTMYRKVISTTSTQQLVLMCLKPGEEIGSETHPHTTQFIRIEAGNGKAVLNGKEYQIADGSAIVIPPGTLHNIINTSDGLMKLYTIYSPPEHEDELVEAVKPLEMSGGRVHMYERIKKDYNKLREIGI